MKVAFIFAVVALSAVQAQILASTGAVVNTGSSSSSRAEDGLGNYQFAYNEQGQDGGSSRSESGTSDGRVQGFYTLFAADGRARKVNYVADEFGYRASIETNEPGAAPLPAADTAINAPDETGIAAATNQRTAEQLKALAEAPPAVEEVKPIAAAPIAAPVVRAQYVQAFPQASYQSVPVGYASYAPYAPVNYGYSQPLVYRAPIATVLGRPLK